MLWTVIGLILLRCCIRHPERWNKYDFLITVATGMALHFVVVGAFHSTLV